MKRRYAGSLTGLLGIHQLDVARWIVRLNAAYDLVAKKRRLA